MQSPLPTTVAERCQRWIADVLQLEGVGEREGVVVVDGKTVRWRWPIGKASPKASLLDEGDGHAMHSDFGEGLCMRFVFNVGNTTRGMLFKLMNGKNVDTAYVHTTTQPDPIPIPLDSLEPTLVPLVPNAVYLMTAVGRGVYVRRLFDASDASLAQGRSVSVCVHTPEYACDGEFRVSKSCHVIIMLCHVS